jgi:hypothetical protein
MATPAGAIPVKKTKIGHSVNLDLKAQTIVDEDYYEHGTRFGALCYILNDTNRSEFVHRQVRGIGSPILNQMRELQRTSLRETSRTPITSWSYMRKHLRDQVRGDKPWRAKPWNSRATI